MRTSLIVATFVLGTTVGAFAAGRAEDAVRVASGPVEQVAQDAEECGAARKALKDFVADRVPMRRADRKLARIKEDDVRRLCGSLGEEAARTGIWDESSGGSGGPEVASAGRTGSSDGGGGGGGSGSSALSMPTGGSSGKSGARSSSVNSPASFAKFGTDLGPSGTKPGDNRSGSPPDTPAGPGSSGRTPDRPDGGGPGTGPAVPGPIAGAGLPAILAGLALWRLRRRFRRAGTFAEI